MKHLLVASDSKTCWKALYIDGEYYTSDESIPIGEFIYASGGGPCTMEYAEVNVYDLSEGFPTLAKDLRRA